MLDEVTHNQQFGIHTAVDEMQTENVYNEHAVRGDAGLQ